MAKRLTARQRSFLKHYIANGCEDAAGAYKAAGFKSAYPSQGAHNLLKQPMMQAELDRLRQQMEKESSLDVQWVVNEFKRALKDAEDSNDTTNRLRSLENIGKIKGAYIERTEDVTKHQGPDSEVAAKMLATILAALAHLHRQHNVPESAAQLALAQAFGLQSALPQGATTH